MKFKVHLLKNHKPDTGRAGLSLSGVLEELKLRYQVHRLGLSHAFAGNTITKVRLNGKAACHAKTPGYEYELNLFGDDYRTMLDLFMGRMKKQFAMTGIGLVSFAALLGIGADKAEAVVQPSIPSASSTEKTKVSSPTVSHTGVESFLDGVYRDENKMEKYRLVYYHNNVNAHVNTTDQHVNTPHTDNAHTNSWTNESSHQNQWNNSPHQNSPGGVHTNAHVNAIPGEYIY